MASPRREGKYHTCGLNSQRHFRPAYSYNVMGSEIYQLPACRLESDWRFCLVYWCFLRDREGEIGGTRLRIVFCSPFLRPEGLGSLCHPPLHPHLPPGPRNPRLAGLPTPDSSFLPQQPRSPAARPFPLAPLQHNGLAALRFHDTPPPGAFALSS